MKYIYIAWQDERTREWIPVAKLEKSDGDYLLSYTQGANQSLHFNGLGRMNDLSKTYSSREIFPFFKNRILSKNRPDYKKYIEWLGLDGVDYDEMELLSISSGSRATDSYEIISPPEKVGGDLSIKFFSRGISHLSEFTIKEISRLEDGKELYLMNDCQNKFDKDAIALRTDDPKFMVGYVPKYYCKAINRFLSNDVRVTCLVLKNNLDAPLSMRLLCSIIFKNCAGEIENFFDSEENFHKWSNEKLKDNISKLIKHNLDF